VRSSIRNAFEDSPRITKLDNVDNTDELDQIEQDNDVLLWNLSVKNKTSVEQLKQDL
jgi:hypothetical protein